MPTDIDENIAILSGDLRLTEEETAPIDEAFPLGSRPAVLPTI